MSDCCLPGTNTETRAYDNLIGDCSVKTQPYILIAGTYARGEVLFKTATAGELTNLATTPASLDADAIAIMPFDVTIASNDEMAVYVGGEFNEEVVTGFTALAAVKEVLTQTGIRLREFAGVA